MSKYYIDNLLGTIWVGEVINVDDPLKISRVKIKVFGKFDELDEEVIPWAIPYNLLSSGTCIIPKIGDIVNVFFENGDENVPFYSTHIELNEDAQNEFKADYPKVWSICYDNKLGVGADGSESTKRSLHIFYTETQGFIIRSSNSLINIREDNSILLKNSKGNKIFHITDKGISLGKENKSNEPSVLGDTLEKLLNSFITELGKISAITTPSGPSGPISGSPQWSALVIKFKKDWADFKSKIVTLD